MENMGTPAPTLSTHSVAATPVGTAGQRLFKADQIDPNNAKPPEHTRLLNWCEQESICVDSTGFVLQRDTHRGSYTGLFSSIAPPTMSGADGDLSCLSEKEHGPRQWLRQF